MKRKILIFLLIILVLGAFLRLWQISSVPPGIYPDEAMNANQAITDPGQIFYPENNGREGLFMNLIFLSFSLFGISVFSLKLIPALAGTLTILGIFLCTKEMFRCFNFKLGDANRVALLASFFLSVSFWHINFSRIAFRAILVPLVLTFSFYFLFKGFRTKKIRNFIFSGAFLGLGLHTYIAIRVTGLITGLILLAWFFVYKKEKEAKKFLKYSSYFVIVTLVVAAPILLYFLNNPQYFVSRATGVSIFSAPSPIKAFFESLGKHLAMFNFYGDINWRHNFSTSPILLWPVGIMFLIGFSHSIKKSFTGKEKSKFIHWILLGWLFFGILPGVLTYEGIPHALRCIGAIPPTFIFVGLGAHFAYEKAEELLPKKRKMLKIIGITALLILVFFQYNKYFKKWANKEEVESAFTKTYVEIGNYLNSLPEQTNKYVIVNEVGSPFYGLSIPAQTPKFIERTQYGRIRTEYLPIQRFNEIKTNSEETIVIPLYNRNIEEKLNNRFSQVETKKENGFWVYKLK